MDRLLLQAMARGKEQEIDGPELCRKDSGNSSVFRKRRRKLRRRQSANASQNADVCSELRRLSAQKGRQRSEIDVGG
jgi:hypothetical protein